MTDNTGGLLGDPLGGVPGEALPGPLWRAPGGPLRRPLRRASRDGGDPEQCTRPLAHDPDGDAHNVDLSDPNGGSILVMLPYMLSSVIPSTWYPH